jgi:hypothetical protein
MSTSTATNRIKEYISKTNGVTAPELERALGLKRGTATSRTSVLARRGELQVSGKKGRAVVYSIGRVAQTPQKTTITKNHLILVLDKSGSMDMRRNELMKLVNEQLNEFKEADQVTSVTEIRFASSSYIQGPILHQNVEEKHLEPFFCSGGTALLDAIIYAIRQGEKFEKDNPDESVLICAFTDGWDNESASNSREILKTLIQEKQAQGNWTFTFQVPKDAEEGHEWCLDFIPKGNIHKWGTMQEAQVASTQGTKNYIAARARGHRQTKHYFAADLSNLDQSLTLLTKMDSTQINFWIPQKEQTIQEFLESKVFPYRPGTGFYQVIKKEKKLPEDRKIILRDRRDGKFYTDGQKSVRALCGWPEKGEIAIQPGNHGHFDIFVQSKSSQQGTFRARILPRGTSVIYWPNA